MSKTNFQIKSEKIVEDFLHTVVIVDDEPVWETPSEDMTAESEKATRKSITVPGRVATEQPQKVGSGESTATEHQLKAKVLTESMAQKAIACTVLQPIYKKELQQNILPVLKNSDVVLLDWQIRSDNGAITLSLIKKIRDFDAEGAERIRLIVIYTGEKDLDGIAEKIAAELSDSDKDEEKKERCVIDCGHLRVAIYAKPDTKLIAELSYRQVNEKDLADKIIEEFSKMTQGLVSNAALEALSAIRTQTYPILAKLNRKLDPAFLSHRALLGTPEEAEEHIAPLIVSEILTVLKNHDIGKNVNHDEIISWLEDRFPNEELLKKSMDYPTEDDARNALIRLLEKGISVEKALDSNPVKWKEKLTNIDKNDSKQLTNIFTRDGDSGEKSDVEFAALTSLQSKYENPKPILSFGSIVCEGDGDKAQYYLCVQQACDSRRIPMEGQPFPFLPLTITSGRTNLNIILYDGAEWKKFKLKLKQHLLNMISFSPDTDKKPIFAKKVGDAGQWTFKSSEQNGEREFRWVAELKPAHAQRIANEFAISISSVGLTESEWLRRKAKKR